MSIKQPPKIFTQLRARRRPVEVAPDSSPSGPTSTGSTSKAHNFEKGSEKKSESAFEAHRPTTTGPTSTNGIGNKTTAALKPGGTVALLTGFRDVSFEGTGKLDTNALDTSALDASALDTSALDTSVLDTSALDTSALDTKAILDDKTGGSLLERLAAGRKSKAKKRNQEVIQNLLPSIEADQNQSHILKTRQPLFPNAASAKAAILDVKTGILSLVVDKLESGERLGTCIDVVKDAIAQESANLRSLNNDVSPGTSIGTKGNANDVTSSEQRLEGLSQALSDVREQAKGWRGLSLTFESGLSIGIPFIGAASLSLGMKVVGPDAGGGPMLRPYVKVAAGGGVGFLGAGGAYVAGRGVKGSSFNFGTSYLSYTPKDPLIGKLVKASMPGVGAAMVTQNGFAVGGRLPILGISPSGFLAVEHPTMAPKTGAVFDAVDNVVDDAKNLVSSLRTKNA